MILAQWPRPRTACHRHVSSALRNGIGDQTLWALMCQAMFVHGGEWLD